MRIAFICKGLSRTETFAFFRGEIPILLQISSSDKNAPIFIFGKCDSFANVFPSIFKRQEIFWDTDM
jgi:hypothetical protein